MYRLPASSPAPDDGPELAPGHALGPELRHDLAQGADTQAGAAPGTELGRRMARISEVAGIGYWSINRRTRRVRWSPDLRALHGLPAHDAAPHPEHWLQRFVHPDDQARVRHVMAHWAGEDGSCVTDNLRILRADGELRHLLTHTLSEVDAETDLRFGVVIDVTPLRQAEDALRAAEDRAALTASALGLGTWETDLRSGRSVWDAAMWRLRGLVPQAEPPPLDHRLALVHADDRQRVRELLQAGAIHSSVEYRVVWPDGQVRWLASRGAVVHDDAGRPLRRIGINWDITAHRMAEAALRERELALRDNETRSRTLARMSHELLTPLNAILGCTQLLQVAEDEGHSHAGVRRQHLLTIEAASRQLLDMVNHVLQLTVGATPRPAPIAAAPAAPAAPAPAGPTARRRHVLYIEDNAVNAMIVSELVKRRGDLDVSIAETGLQGLDMAAELQPALVLLDMQLPDIDGSEVFQRLRADVRTAGLPCIALSANALPEDIEVALAAGMTAYWTKPLDFRAFAQQLDAIFGPAPGRAPPAATPSA